MPKDLPIRNEAAERLRDQINGVDKGYINWPEQQTQMIADALAAERRATVDEIRSALGPRDYPTDGKEWDRFIAILDKVAQR